MWWEKLALEKAAWVYSLHSPVYTVYTLYKLLTDTAHPTGLNCCTLCTLTANSLKLTAVSIQSSAYSLQLSALSIQLSAFSLQLSAFSFQPSAFILQKFPV